MNLQKAAFLRVNLERMLFSEALKLWPDLRPTPEQVNRLEKLVDPARIGRLRGEPVQPERIQQAVEQAEAVYVFSLLKSITMTEIEEENPKFTQYVTGFKV